MASAHTSVGMDPAILLGALKDFSGQLEALCAQRREVLGEARFYQRLIEEFRERLSRESTAFLAEIRETVAEVDNLCAQTAILVENLEKTAERIETGYDQAVATLGEAMAARDFWREEVGKAHIWHNTALALENQVEEQIRFAELHLSNCRKRLSASRAALADAREKHAGDTTLREADFEKAKEAVRSANQRLSERKRELDEAHREAARARAQISSCQQAQRDCEQAISAGARARDWIQRARVSASRGLDSAQHAKKEASFAKGCISSALEKTQLAVSVGKTVLESSREGGILLGQAGRKADHLRSVTLEACRELEQRRGWLRAFDAPVNC